MMRDHLPHHVVYRLRLDGVVRYVGEGWYKRPFEHRAEVIARLAGHGSNDQYKLYNVLCSAMVAGSVLEEEVVIWGLTKIEARAAEKLEIAQWPEDQLLNWTKSDQIEHLNLARSNSNYFTGIERRSNDRGWMTNNREQLARLHSRRK